MADALPPAGRQTTPEPDVARALEFLNAVYHHPDVQGTDAQRWARMACEALRPGWRSPTVAVSPPARKTSPTATTDRKETT